MALITPSTFDPLKFRCNVRLQQGVPVVDADWNELDDIRKFEMRAYLKWFVGDGVPDGVDSFKIVAVGGTVADDFVIRSAVTAPAAGASNTDIALRNVGRFIVDGLDVLIKADVNYKAQTINAGLPPIQPIPNISGAVAIYLDVWERLITSQEDNSLVLPGLGVESAARMKREWCVRTRAGSAAPIPGDGDYMAGHSYAVLATLKRQMNGASPAPIADADFTDLRHARLTLSAVEQRLATLERLLLTPSFNAQPNEFDPKLGVPGTVVRLLGNNLSLGLKEVRFGNAVAALTGQQTPTQLNVLVPSMPPGTVPISLTNAGGVVATTQDFQVLPPAALVAPTFKPTPNQFDPKIGSHIGATLVTLFGSHFDQPNLQVVIAGTPAPLAGPIADGLITVNVGPVPFPGQFQFSLANAGGAVLSDDKFSFT